MGIFEIIILVSAVIIFIIFVRRFPETASPNATTKNQSSFHLPRIPRPHFSLPKRSALPASTDMPVIPTADMETTSTASESPFSEPGSTFADFDQAKPTVRPLLQDGQKYFELRQYDSAERAYLKAAAEDPTCVAAYYKLGCIYLYRATSFTQPEANAPGRPNTALTDAEEAFHQASKFAPDNPFITHKLGQAAALSGNFNEAINRFEQALTKNESRADWWADCGGAALSLRQYAKAVRYFSRAWSLDPKNNQYKSQLDDAKDRERRLRAAKM